VQPIRGKVPKTDVGKETLHHFGLNRREVLLKERKLAFKNARALPAQYCNAVVVGGEDEEEPQGRINDIWNGREPYTAMRRLGFEMIRKRVIAGGLNTSCPLQPDP
jgi:hypothetical protein